MSNQDGRKARLNAALHLKLHFKRNCGESERWRRSSAGGESLQALAGEKRETCFERGSYTTREASTALAGK